MNDTTNIVPKGFSDLADPSMPLLSGSLNGGQRTLREVEGVHPFFVVSEAG